MYHDIHAIPGSRFSTLYNNMDYEYLWSLTYESGIGNGKMGTGMVHVCSAMNDTTENACMEARWI